MMDRERAIGLCLEFPFVYEDYPFDANWAAMRHKENDKVFAFIFDYDGHDWMNVKATPAAGELWREVFPDVYPAYHMNKTHWIGIRLDGTMSAEDIRKLVQDSYELTARKRKRL